MCGYVRCMNVPAVDSLLGLCDKHQAAADTVKPASIKPTNPKHLYMGDGNIFRHVSEVMARTVRRVPRDDHQRAIADIARMTKVEIEQASKPLYIARFPKWLNTPAGAPVNVLYGPTYRAGMVHILLTQEYEIVEPHTYRAIRYDRIIPTPHLQRKG